MIAGVGVLLGLICFAGFMAYKYMANAGGSKKDKQEFVATTQDNLAFEYIKKRIMKLKKGGYRIAIEIPNVNTQLMDNNEIESVFWIYKEILDSIEFPFQLVQQSRTLDISDYYDLLRVKIAGSKNKLEEKELELYQDFVRDLIADYSILTKNTYMVIPYDEERERKSNINNKQKAKKRNKNNTAAQDKEFSEKQMMLEEQRFEKAKKELESRADFIVRSLKRLPNVEPHVLNDQEFIDLIYVAYNKEKSIVQPLMYTNSNEFTTMYVKPTGGQEFEE